MESKFGRQTYIFFSEHFLAVASHVPPAFVQSASLVAFVTSPANAGAVKPRANANAKMETSVFMDVHSVLLLLGGAERTPADRKGSSDPLLLLLRKFICPCAALLHKKSTKALPTQSSNSGSSAAAGNHYHEPLVRSSITALLTRLSA
jgi:hypothetical protein